MTTGQTIEAKIIVDANQATAEIDKFNGKLSSVETNIGKAGAALPQLEKSSGMAASKMLILGQAVDDAQYGLRGVVNNMPQVVQAFGGGLGLAGAVGIAAVAVSQLYDAYQAYDKIQQEVIDNSHLWKDALQSVDRTMREGTNKSAADLKQILKETQDELRNFGKTSREMREEQARAIVASTESKLQNLAKGIPEQEANLAEIRRVESRQRRDQHSEELREMRESQETMVANLRARREELKRLIVEQQTELSTIVANNKQAVKNEEDAARAAAAAAAAKERRIKATEDEKQSEIDMWNLRVARDKAEREAKLAQIEEDRKLAVERIAFERKAQEDAEKERTRAAKEAAKERARIAKEEAKAKADAEKQFTQMFTQMGQQAASTALSTSQDYIEAKIKGEKYAEQKAVASFLSATGQQLVGSGTRAIFEGAIISANPLTPGMGAGMIATGVAAIAAGVGMGAGGAAVANTIPAEKMTDKKASRDRGASPRSSSGGSTGGPLVINVSYGVGGPLPEDTAREIARVMRTGDRRRGAA